MNKLRDQLRTIRLNKIIERKQNDGTSYSYWEMANEVMIYEGALTRFMRGITEKPQDGTIQLMERYIEKNKQYLKNHE